MKKILNTILLIIFLSNSLIYSAEYYVSATGDSLNLGTFDSPFFLKVQQAADVMQSGDICYIKRQGVYHEEVSIDNRNGTSSSPIIFTSYQDERVVFDGTKQIDSEWIQFSGDIWVTEIDFDIWQLFIDYEEMVMARWPNANFIDGSIWDKENHWGHGLIDDDENAYENGTMIDKPNGNVSLENIGFDIVGATAILNVGSLKLTQKKYLHTMEICLHMNQWIYGKLSIMIIF